MFRAGAVSLPWSEDWIWQSPVGSQQMMALSIDAMRSGVLWAGEPQTVPAEVVASITATGRYTRLTPPAKHTPMLMYVYASVRTAVRTHPYARGCACIWMRFTLTSASRS
jgi:hypothetical protein